MVSLVRRVPSESVSERGGVLDTTLIEPALIEPATAEEAVSIVRRNFNAQRDRAPRLTGLEVPWVTSVTLPWGLEVRLLNISRTGMLVESAAKFTPGTVAEFRIAGRDGTLVVPARLVRSEIAAVNGRGVRYHSAAAFDRELDLVGPKPGASEISSISADFADWLRQLSVALDRNADADTLCRRIDEGLRKLARVRDVQFRDAPAARQDGCESVCFTVPKGNGASGVLQAAFAPGQLPSELDFRLLQAGAALAAVVLALRQDPRGQQVQ